MPNSVEELNTRISQAMLRVDKEMLDGIWAELEYRLDMPFYKWRAYRARKNLCKVLMRCISLPSAFHIHT
jgi:hypothetical protein